jgi:glyoxylase-like metal-dependent hydrolase (beta-lactamase superfamily II)
MLRITSVALAAALALAAGVANSQGQDFSKVQIKTTDLGHNTYMLEGSGGNMTVIVGSDGVILVDGEFAPLHDKIKEAIAKVTDQPVRYLINTHFHGDHTGGNAPFAKDGASVVSQVNVKNRLAEGTVNGLNGAKTKPVEGDGLPSKTYTTSLTLQVKGRTAQLRHIANAHTDGDTYVWIPDANVIATGDILTLGRYPNIDFANGGNIKGMIAGTEAYLKLANDQTKLVPGHGSLADKKTLSDYHDMLVTVRDRMQKLIDEGKSEADAIAARPYADFDKQVGANDQASQNFIRVVYHSLKPT